MWIQAISLTLVRVGYFSGDGTFFGHELTGKPSAAEIARLTRLW
jgi:hypothetical protein